MTVIQRIRAGVSSEAFLYLVFAMLFVGLYYSRAMVSLFDVGIAGIGLFVVSGKADWRRRLWNQNTRPFILISVLYILSGLLSQHIDVGLHRIKMNNYYLFIPVGLSCLQPMRKEFISNLLLLFVAITSVSAIAVLFQYFTAFGDSNSAYQFGKTMETPILHIRYSYFICLAAVTSLGLFIEKCLDSSILSKVNIACGVFLVAFLHVLAVRTGIVSFYLAGAVYLVWRGRQLFTMRQLIVIALSMVVVLVAAIKLLPSLAMKIQYTVYDLKMFFNETGNYLYSDNLRLMSIQSGIDIIKESPLFGTGIGDLDARTLLYYQTHFPDVPEAFHNPPINQLFYTYTAFGLIGGTIFFSLLLSILFYKSVRKNTLAILIMVATFGSFIGDYSIELQLGKAAFVTLISLALWWSAAEKQT